MGIGAIALVGSLMNIVAPKAVHAAVAALVQVVNTPTTAVPTVAAPAANQLYASHCDAANSPGTFSVQCAFDPPPAGQTLFIETMSITCNSPHGSPPVQTTISNGSGVQQNIPMVFQGTSNGIDFFAGALTGRIWVKAGTTPTCSVFPNTDIGNFFINCGISGYLAPAQ
jgi:hypothetical protein